MVNYKFHPPSQADEYYLLSIGNIINYYIKTNGNIILVGDFNMKLENNHMQMLMSTYDITDINSKLTCFKPVNHPSCIDLISTNRKNHFQSTNTIESGISDFHKMVLTVLKTNFVKSSKITILYRNYNKIVFLLQT